MNQRERWKGSLGGLLANEPGKALRLERALHSTHTVLPLGMPQWGLVVDPGRATQEKRGPRTALRCVPELWNMRSGLGAGTRRGCSIEGQAELSVCGVVRARSDLEPK